MNRHQNTAEGDEAPDIRSTPWQAAREPGPGRWPGPADASAPLRAAIDDAAFAEVIAHARSSLDREICGVLLGRIQTDGAGLFVHVQSVIRGSQTGSGATHVTFTHETWDAIHQEKERLHPRADIVGWYHSHPGFGVEFSAMDAFIQRNFFGQPGQIGLVTDPLRGGENAYACTAEGMVTLGRFWVGGREMRCAQAASPHDRAADQGSGGGGGGSSRLDDLERRMGTVVEVLDATRNDLSRFLMLLGFLALVGVACVMLRMLWGIVYPPGLDELPKVRQTVQIPVQIDGQTVQLSVGVYESRVPDRLNAVLVQRTQVQRTVIDILALGLGESARSEADPVRRQVYQELARDLDPILHRGIAAMQTASATAPATTR